MTHKKEVVFSLLFVIMVLCTGCSDKDNGDTSKNNRTSGESFVQEETIESTDNTDNADGSSAPTPELKTPRTKKELEDALGTVNESGKWTPPAGSHIAPKTGILLILIGWVWNFVFPINKNLLTSSFAMPVLAAENTGIETSSVTRSVPGYYKCTGSDVNIRSGPGTQYTIVGTLNYGTKAAFTVMLVPITFGSFKEKHLI